MKRIKSIINVIFAIVLVTIHLLLMYFIKIKYDINFSPLVFTILFFEQLISSFLEWKSKLHFYIYFTILILFLLLIILIPDLRVLMINLKIFTYDLKNLD